MWGHVKRRVVDVATLRGDELPLATAHRGASNLHRVALLDDDLRAMLQAAIEGALRDSGVEGHVVVIGEHGQWIRANLVSKVSICADAVGAHDHHIHLASLHEAACHVVVHERAGHASLHKLPHRKARALVYRARLVHPHLLYKPGLVAVVDDRCDRAIERAAQ